LEYPDLRKGKVGEANCYLIEAKSLFDTAIEKFASNPLYFVVDK